MPHSRRLHHLTCRVAHVGLSIAFFLMLSFTCLYSEALAADGTMPQINPQLQRPQDIPLERLERQLRTPPAPMKPVNLNTASIEELIALPDISSTVAQQIIESRPYHAKTDLVEKHILPDVAYERVKNLITIE